MAENEITSRSTQNHSVGYLITLSIVFVLALWGLFDPKSLGSALSKFATTAIVLFDKPILMVGLLTLVVAIAVCVSPVGRRRIGDKPPAFSRFSFIAMVFSGAQGGALVTWSVYQPAAFFHDIPVSGLEGNDYVSTVIAYSAFHWSAPVYAIWALAAVSVILVVCNKSSKDHSISSGIDAVFSLEHRASISASQRKAILTGVDVICIFALLFAFSANMAILGKQIASGLALQFEGAPILNWIGERSTIVLVSGFAGFISILGLHKGIARFSSINVVIAFGMLISIFVLSSSMDILSVVGDAVRKLMGLMVTLPLDLVSTEDPKAVTFRREWTAVNYLWAFAYISLYVTYYLRIGAGRTVRELVLVTTLVPSVAALLWLGIFGGGALISPNLDVASLVDRAAAGDQSVFYTYLYSLPYSTLFASLSLFILAVFAVTTYAPLIYELSSSMAKTSLHRQFWLKVFWTASLAILAIVIAMSPSLKVVLQFTTVGAYAILLIYLVLIAGAAWKSGKSGLSLYKTNRSREVC